MPKTLKKMNGLTSSTSLSSWGESKTNKGLVFEIIDSKLNFIELNTRRLLNKFRSNGNIAKEEPRTDDNYALLTMVDLHIDKAETEQVFDYLEKLSQTICILEQLKYSIREENICSILELLDGDKYVDFTEAQLEQVLSRTGR